MHFLFKVTAYTGAKVFLVAAEYNKPIHLTTTWADSTGNKAFFFRKHRQVCIAGISSYYTRSSNQAEKAMTLNIRTFQGITPTLGKDVYVDPAATVIGDVVLGDDASVWPGAVIRGDMHKIRIGNRTNVQDNAVLHITHASNFNPDGWPLIIGDDVVIGHRALLHGCTIGNKILIGNGAIVNDGAIIEDQVIVGAGCVVPPGKRLQSGYVYIGNPCKQGRPLTESEMKFFTYSPLNYVKLKNQYLAEQQ